MTEFLEHFRSWAAVLISLALFLFTVTSSRGKAAKEEQDKLGKRIDNVEAALASDAHNDQREFGILGARLQRVEDELKHMPTKDQFNAMQISLSEMKGDVRELRSDLKPLASTVTRIDDYLMTRGGKG